MRRERPVRLPESLRLSPKLQASPLVKAAYLDDLLGDLNILYIVTAALIVSIVTFLVARHRRNAQASLLDVPWVHRNPREWFSKLRVRMWTTLHYEAALKEAYHVYSKNGVTCVLSSLDGDAIVLPPSAIPWLINQPDTAISTDESTKHVLQTKYSFTVPEIMDRTIHFDVIKGDLTRQVFHMTDEVRDELEAAVDELLGTDTKAWKPISLFDTVTHIVARINSRVFVGLPLCRNEKYLKNAVGFAEDVVLSATLLRLFPPFARPFVAPLVTIPNKLHARGYTKMIKPELSRRQQLAAENASDPEKTLASKTSEPNDYLTWLLNRSPPGFQSSLSTLIARLLHLNFASIHTTSFIGTNTLFDLLSPSSTTYLPQIREEANSLRPLDRRSLQKMHILDACLRESSRLASIIGLGINVKVVARDGIEAPDGTLCPYGSLISVPSWAIHNDEELYPDPLLFNPERYLDSNTAADGAEGQRKEKTYLERANLSFVSTSPTYLGFGHGRHACPGRFFAAQELKLLISYLVCSYEMELVDKDADGGRVKNVWMGPNHVPPLKAKIRVRRKEKEDALGI